MTAAERERRRSGCSRDERRNSLNSGDLNDIFYAYLGQHTTRNTSIPERLHLT